MHSPAADAVLPTPHLPPEDGAAGEGLYGQSLPMLLLRARESVMRYFRPNLRAYSLTEQQWRILRVLAADDGPIEMLELATRCAIQPPSLSRTVPRMVERQLVSRSIHPHDQRRVVVALTEAGRAMFEAVAVGAAQSYAAIERIYGRDRMDALYALLNAMIALPPPDTGED